MKKFLACLLAVLLLLVLPAAALAYDADRVTVAGPGVEREISYTRDELAAMREDMLAQTFSTVNTYPTAKTYYAEGLPLSALLAAAGLKTEATSVTIAALDAAGNAGYAATLLLDDLTAARYYFPATGEKVAVQPLLVLRQGAARDQLSESDITFMLGQLDKQEQTNPLFVSNVRLIYVDIATPQRLAGPYFTISGDAVTLQHDNANAKIYYTLDGGEPDVHSGLYNISAERFQPALNQPVKPAAGQTLQAVAYAAGYLPSEVLTVPLDYAFVFPDVPGNFWAETAIAAMKQQDIINGMGGLYQPDGPLTRAQFAKIMVLALGGSLPAVTQAVFNDVAATAWYAPYVKKVVELGLIEGYADGSFRPDNPISKQEMLKVAVCALPDGAARAEAFLAAHAEESRFAAGDGLTDWARGYVEYAYALGLLPAQMLREQGGALFIAGGSAASRAEAAYVVHALLAVK